MSLNEILAISPIVIVSLGVVTLMLLVSFIQNISYGYGCFQLFLLAALLSFSGFWFDPLVNSRMIVGELLIVDYFTQFFSVLIILATMVVACFVNDDSRNDQGILPGEVLFKSYASYYLMLLLATLGSLIVVSAIHFAAWFLGMEILVVSLYGLLSFHTHNLLPVNQTSVMPYEASFKFLVLSALSSSFMLFGFAMLYGVSGMLRFDEYYLIAHLEQPAEYFMVVGGTAMILVGMGYKLSLVPFHQWTPDVYQGAPTLITGYLATVSKAIMLVILIRFFMFSGIFILNRVLLVVAIMAILSMIVGNLLALNQSNIKRLLAYSSIAHVGYILVAFIAASISFQHQSANFNLALEAVSYYIVAYFLMTLSVFVIVHRVSDRADAASDDPFLVEYYRGLLWRSPWMGLALIICLLSLAGIPLTAGFIGKFYLFASGISQGLWVMLGGLVVGSVIGLYYYLNLVLVVVGRKEPADDLAVPATGAGFSLPSTVLTALVSLILLLGLYPNPMIDLLPALDGQLRELVFAKVDG